MGSEQALLGGNRSGGFCLVTDEIRICSEGKIRPTGKGSKGISTPRPAAATTPSLVCFPLGFLTALVDIVLVFAPWTAKGGVGPAA